MCLVQCFHKNNNFETSLYIAHYITTRHSGKMQMKSKRQRSKTLRKANDEEREKGRETGTDGKWSG